VRVEQRREESRVSSEFEPVLLRHLRRSGIIDLADDPPTVETWSRFLRVVNDYYRNTEQDRQLLLRSNELASAEVDEVRRRLEAQKKTMRLALATMADALGVFGRIAFADDSSPDGLPSLEAATEDATRRLQALFGETLLDETSAELTGVRTNLVRLAEAVGKLLDEMHEKARLKREVDAAVLAQSFLVPIADRLEAGDLEVVGTCLPFAGCGGDLWHTQTLPDGRVLVLVGDVTGHGIASSVIAGVARAASHVALRQGVSDPSALLGVMNDAILETARKTTMMTCGVSTFDPATRKLVIASAGQNFPFHIQQNTLRPVVVEGPPLGEAESPTYKPVEIVLEKGDLLVWFTDGLVEAENEWEEQLGDKRLRSFCQHLHGKDARTVCTELTEMLTAFRGSQRQGDDITAVVLSLR
jgi:sigma-B regulation protein RsbU (phosphoserine phosphatase)